MALLSRRQFFTRAANSAVVISSAGFALPAQADSSASPRSIRYSRVVDLTHTLTSDFPTFSGKSQLEMSTVGTLAKDGFNYFRWNIVEHTGTHLDAPLHRSNGVSADRISPEALIGPLVIVDIRQRAGADSDSEVTLEDLKSWESHHGRIASGAIVAMNSGWDAHVRTAKFRNSDDDGHLHFPVFHAEAAEFLLSKREVVGIAVDTLSLDRGSTKDFPVHTRWLGSNRWGLECIANLAELPPQGATIIVGGPKIASASGGPSRVFALV